MIVSILTALAPVVALMGIGVALRQFKWLPPAIDQNIMRLVIGLFYPALILKFILGNPALARPENIFLPPLLGFSFVVLGYLIANLVARLIGLRIGKGRRSFTFCAGIQNYGYIPIPLIAILFDNEGTLGVLMLHNVGVEVAIWTVGILYLQGSLSRDILRRLFNPPVIALLIALSLNLTGIEARLPEGFHLTIDWLAGCAIPLGLILSGAGLRDLLDDRAIRREWRVPLAGVATRLCLIPAAMLAIGLNFPGISEELGQVIIIQAAMPAAILPIVLTKHYGGEVKVAVQIVVGTTIGALVTIPLWLQAFL